MALRSIIAGLVTVAAVGCALIAGVPDRSGTFCTQQSYELCEDFDNPGAAFHWSLASGKGEPDFQINVVPRGKSPPNAVSTLSPVTTGDANAAAPFIHVFDRGPDGLVLGFSFFVESVNLTSGGPPETDGGTDIIGSSVIVALVQWESGIIMLMLRGNDELYLLRAARINDNPAFGRSTRLNSRNKASIRNTWLDIELRIDLGASTVTCTKCPDGLTSGDIPAEAKINAKTTQALFGPISIGPSGANAILLDNIYAGYGQR